MKKIILSMALAIICGTSFAQFEVVSNGSARIIPPYSTPRTLYVENTNALGIGMELSSNRYGIKVSGTNSWGLSIYTLPMNTYSCKGIMVSSNDTANNKKNMGIVSLGAPSTSKSIGVLGGMVQAACSPYTTVGAGIYGTSGSETTGTGLTSGLYAGFFHGDVRVTGSIYGTLITPSKSSTSSTEGNGERSIGVQGGVADKLNQVQLLQFHRPTQEEEVMQNKIQQQARGENDQDAEEEVDDMEEAFGKKIVDNEIVPQTELATVQYGLAADQLRQVFPELVYEDENGNLSINYIEMIPLLVQALNEQQARIDMLEGKTGKTHKAKKIADATSITSANDEVIALAQNKPNPFSETTEIALTIPADVQTAAVFFYDMTGKQVAKQVVTERGSTSITVSGSNLTEGMYIYSLIADGKVVATKKMVLTK